MIYLIGGAARSGKTILSKRLLTGKSIPYFCIDYLVSAIDRTLHNKPSFDAAMKIQPQLESMIRNITEIEPDYIVEGDKILPELASRLSKEYPNQIISCFLGYASADPSIKMEEIKQNPGPINNWTKNSSNEELMQLIAEMTDYSAFIKKECNKYDIPYFDVSNNFSKNIDLAFQYLSINKST
ncbi:MAG: hypothetical protein WC788_00850 [Candidatus Paceibacterota bacterium]|jgi:hypothetical protein